LIQSLRATMRSVAVRMWVRMTAVGDEAGQTVAEYALVLLVAAAIAGALLIWAKQSGKLDAFFDAVFSKLLGSIDPSSTPAPTP
jgi:Flp pilus assembly pilin Flp